LFHAESGSCLPISDLCPTNNNNNNNARTGYNRIDVAIFTRFTLALSISAGRLVGHCDVKVVIKYLPSHASNDQGTQDSTSTDAQALFTIARAKHPGNGSVMMHDSVCAPGEWDGKHAIHSLSSIASP